MEHVAADRWQMTILRVCRGTGFCSNIHVVSPLGKGGWRCKIVCIHLYSFYSQTHQLVGMLIRRSRSLVLDLP